MPSTVDGTIRSVAVMQDGGFVGTVNRFIGSLGSFASKMTKVQAALLGLGAAFGIVLISQILKSANEMRLFETQTANLIKVLNDADTGTGIANAIGELSKTLPIAREELLRVAEIAARLGIRGAKDITEFTRVSAMIGIATDLSADQAADAFARIFKATRTAVSEFETVAGVFNELSNTMATTTSEIVDAVRRSAPELSRLGLSVNEIAVLNAGLNEVSESASRVGTRLNRFAQALNNPSKIGVFANALKKPTAEFEKMLEADPRQVILDLIRAFREGGRAADVLASGLDSRVFRILAASAQNLEGIESAFRRMDIEAASSISSIVEEFQVFDKTLVATEVKLENFSKELRRTFVGGAVLSFLTKFKDGLLSLLALAEGELELKDIVPSPAAVKDYEEAVDALTQKLVKLRTTNDDIDAKTAASMRMSFGSFQRFTDDMIRASRGFRVETTAIASQMIDNLDANALAPERFKEIATESRGSLAKFVQLMKLFGDNATEGGERMKTWRAAVVDALDIASEEGNLEDFNEIIESVTEQMDPFLKAIIEMIKGTGSFSDATADLEKRLRIQRAELMGVAHAAIIMSDGYTNAKDRTAELDILLADIDALTLRKEVIDELFSSTADWVTAMEEASAAAEKQSELMEEALTAGLATGVSLSQRIKLLQEESDVGRAAIELRIKQETELFALREQFKNQPNILAALEEDLLFVQALERFDAVRVANQKSGDALQKRLDTIDVTTAQGRIALLVDAIEEIGSASGDVFDVLIGKTDEFGQAMVDMIQRVARTIFESQIESLLFKAFGRILDAGSTGFTVGGGPFKPQKVLTGALGFATGGTIGAGQLSIVGERGPELFVPNVSGTVVPNSKLGGNTETFIIHNTFRIEAMDGASVRNALIREKKTIEAITLGGINRSRNLKKSGVF